MPPNHPPTKTNLTNIERPANQQELAKAIKQSLLDATDRRPVLLFIAGPNGSGKSSLFQELDAIAPGRHFAFINADQIAQIIKDVPAPDVLAQKFADIWRQHLVDQRVQFATESVFSDELGAKLGFLRDAQKAGFRVVMIFVALPNWQTSMARVQYRVTECGGHDVPTHKLHRRFIASNENARKAAYFVDTAVFIDNGSADLSQALKLSAMVTNGSVVYRTSNVPDYIEALLPV